MDYETLRKFQRMERNSSNLAELSASFYTDLLNLIRDCTEKYEKSRSSEEGKTLENIKKIAQDIFERREQKLVMKALRCSRNRELKEDNAVEWENELLESLKNSMRENRSCFEKILVAESFTPEKKGEIISEKSEEMKDAGQSEDLNMVLVRILKNIPKFVSSDMSELGPFEANEIKRLPEKEAVLLSEKKFAEII